MGTQNRFIVKKVQRIREMIAITPEEPCFGSPGPETQRSCDFSRAPTGLNALRLSIAARSSFAVPSGSVCARRSSSAAGRPMSPQVAQSPRESSRAWQCEQCTSNAPCG